MAGSRAGRCFEGCHCCEETCLRIDGEDTHEIGAEIWDYDVRVCWVDKSFVRVRGVLTGGVGAWCREGEREGLEGFESA
jgi:hypothetical protein